MPDEKVNDSGFIPDLREIHYGGRDMYFKRATLMMGIFQGVGISQVLLEKFCKHKEIMIRFEGKGKADKKYDGTYLATMGQFRKSDKKFPNGYDDVQRFVSFKDMVKLEGVMSYV